MGDDSEQGQDEDDDQQERREGTEEVGLEILRLCRATGQALIAAGTALIGRDRSGLRTHRA